MTVEVTPELFASVPDAHGRFGQFGGKFVAETLMSALADLESLYASLKSDPAFLEEFDRDLPTTWGALRLFTRRLDYPIGLAVRAYFSSERI